MTKNRKDALRAFQERWGYQFHDVRLLEEAFIHRSVLNEHPEKARSNERLEFLGDAVLEIISSAYLFRAFPTMSEGELSRRRSLAVQEESFAALGRAIGLPSLLLLGTGAEQEGGREKPSLIADCFEAVCGAVYLDGGFSFLEKWFVDRLEEMTPLFERALVRADAKTALQTVLFKEGKTYTYALVKEEGPPHDRHFEMALMVEGKQVSIGTGKSKKRAEAEAALRYLEEKDATENH